MVDLVEVQVKVNALDVNIRSSLVSLQRDFAGMIGDGITPSSYSSDCRKDYAGRLRELLHALSGDLSKFSDTLESFRKLQEKEGLVKAQE